MSATSEEKYDAVVNKLKQYGQSHVLLQLPELSASNPIVDKVRVCMVTIGILV